MRKRLQSIVSSNAFQLGILLLIIGNAILLGLQTVDRIEASYGPMLARLDSLIIYIFVVELIMRFAAEPRTYFRSGWNVFDFLIVAVSLFAAHSGLAAIRAFRILRILRVVTVIPRMRTVVSALFESVPGIASAGVVLVLILYIFSVIAATLFGAEHPALFGDVFIAMYTLFTVMTLEGWREIADPVGDTHPWSWAFFLTYLLIATFTLLNLFVAIVVRVVEEDSDAQMIQQSDVILNEVRALRSEVADLKERLGGADPAP